jgi:DNA-binding GntR family transcriptional regulator
MEQFGLSRTPVREALNRLAAEGLVEIRANRGVLVQSMNLAEVARFFDAYVASERLIGFFCRFSNPGFETDMTTIQERHDEAVRNDEFLEIVKTNSEFHMRIAAATENPYIERFSRRIHLAARRLVYFVYQTEAEETLYYEEQQSSILDEHGQVLKRIHMADRDGLVDVLTVHAKRFQHRVSRFIDSGRGAEFPVI